MRCWAEKVVRWTLSVALVGVVGWSVGCAKPSRVVVFVPEGEPVQLAEPAKARVYAETSEGRIASDEPVEIPAGWWCLPDPGEGE